MYVFFNLYNYRDIPVIRDKTLQLYILQYFTITRDVYLLLHIHIHGDIFL